ncbi:cupredoxin family copper-binding protein [Candidatus Woesearchaeota archaeon]|nr:cupredoxin family copper-binding protein [Candidatus Woesearchaeota archaeon]
MKKMIFVLLTLLLLAACSTAVQQETQTQQQTTVVVDQKAVEVVQEVQRQTTPTIQRVQINNFAFIPERLTVNVGDTVVWVNNDKVVHTVTAKDNEFDSLSLKQDAKFEHTFTKKGTYAYECSIHPGMTGSIKVE